MVNEREIILNILLEMENQDLYEQTLIQNALSQYDYLDTKEKSFIKRVCSGTLERKIQLDYILNSFSKTKTNKMDKAVRNILRMSVYQILFMDSVPDSAAVNEAVKLTAKKHLIRLKGFVNGVLRNIVRNADNIKYPDKSENNGISYLSVVYSTPEWLCKKWISELGFEKTEDILKAFLEVRPTIIRVDERLSKTDRDELISDIKNFGNGSTIVRQSRLLPYAYELEKTDNIIYLPGFEDGKWSVQDVSSMLVSEIAGIKKNDVVVDVCAAPGGKSMHAASKLNNTGKVISRDVSEKKCDIIKENVSRMKLENVEISVHDAREHDDSLENIADILYLDVPCSGLGIIGRKADIKYNASPEGLDEICKLQQEIIENVWDYVKVGGTLIYSTCTINPVENEKNVQWICENYPFETVSIKENVPESMKNVMTLDKGYIQLYPGEYGTDGFFISKLKRLK